MAAQDAIDSIDDIAAIAGYRGDSLCLVCAAEMQLYADHTKAPSASVRIAESTGSFIIRLLSALLALSAFYRVLTAFLNF